MVNHEIPLLLVNELRCRHCEKFVSCGPVHVVPDGSILCGRCRALAKPKFRNYAYEAIARCFMYPCCYWSKHCPRVFTWNECFEHEPDCVYNTSCRLFCTHLGVFCSSERKIPRNVPDTPLEQLPEEALEILKCVMCESYLSCDPIFIGPDGRNICNRCTVSNGIPNGVVKNISYEKIASAVIFPCIYRFRGCTVRLRFGRAMMEHEITCSYGQVKPKSSKKPSKDGKERGVIPTHSGHIWGTITPLSAPFAPPSNKSKDSGVAHELEVVIKKKQGPSPELYDELKTPESIHQPFDTQSFESMFSHSVASSVTHISQDDLIQDQRGLYRTPTKRSADSNLSGYLQDQQYSRKYSNQESIDSTSTKYTRTPSRTEEPRVSSQLSPTGYYQENIDKWVQPTHLSYHYPPIYLSDIPEKPVVRHSSSYNYSQEYRQQMAPQRTESWRVGNSGIIAELKLRQHKKHKEEQKNESKDNPYGNCSNLQDIVQTHEKVFAD